MAHAFDNRNFISGKQQTFYSTTVPLSSRRDEKNDLWERSSAPQLSSRLNHPPSSYEETGCNKVLANHSNSKSSSNDSSYRQRHYPVTDDCFSSIPKTHSIETKPPPPARIPRMTSTTNNNYIRRPNILSQYTPNGTKTNTTYLTTTQLYITQPSSRDHPPPPPPPRYPLHPPAIPPRNPLNSYQKNSVTIPDFNSSISPKTIYRSTAERDHLNDQNSFEQQFNSLSVDNNNHHHPVQDITNGSTVGEYFGECRKCGETITSVDDPCDILGQIYHGSCAVCVLCGQSVQNKQFFIKDQLYCEEDFLNTGFRQTSEHCVSCNRSINDTILQALGESYHLACFKCSKCSICLDGRPFIRDKNRNLFCVRDYHMTYGPRCNKCSNPICPEDNSNETVRIVSMGKTFHIQCYQCEDCSMQLGDEQDRRCHPLDDTLLCQECFYQRLVYVNKF